MPSREATLLTDFLLAPAPLRNVMTKTQFVKLFQKQAANPAVPAMYRELHELRERDIATVGQDIADEVRRSTRLKKQYAQQRRQLEDAHVAGLDPVSLGMEQEVRILHHKVCSAPCTYTPCSCPVPSPPSRILCRRFMPA